MGFDLESGHWLNCFQGQTMSDLETELSGIGRDPT